MFVEVVSNPSLLRWKCSLIFGSLGDKKPEDFSLCFFAFAFVIWRLCCYLPEKKKKSLNF